MLTHHYERRDDGFYLCWGADFASEAGERKLYDGPELRKLTGLDEETQKLYSDLRTEKWSEASENSSNDGQSEEEYWDAYWAREAQYHNINALSDVEEQERARDGGYGWNHL